jgi:hypothetical protein
MVLEARRSLECLNGIRRPDLWGRVVRERLTQDLTGNRKDLAGEVARVLGLDLEWGETPEGNDRWVIRSKEGEWTLLDVLNSVTSEGQLSFIFEGKSLRLTGPDEAEGFWRRWWNGEK